MPEPVYFPYHPQTQLIWAARRITRLERRPIPFVIVDHHKVFSDRTTTKVRDPAFQWHISDDIMDSGLDVVAFRPYVTTTGGACSMRLVNVATGDTLVTTTIPAGDKTVYESDDIDECANYLNWVAPAANRIAPQMKIVTTAGGGTKGLGFYIYYGHDRRP